jgi:hypothetical protein
MGVHDVKNYPEVKKLLGIPEDEPIFIIRAQDDVSIEAIAKYAGLAEKAGVNPNFLSGLVDVQLQFGEWRRVNREKVKIPD